jgi:hypothetical protein
MRKRLPFIEGDALGLRGLQRRSPDSVLITAAEPLFDRIPRDNYHLLVAGKQDRLHVWKDARGREASGAEEPR